MLYAPTRIARPALRTIVSAVLVSVLGAALLGCSSPAADAPAGSPSGTTHSMAPDTQATSAPTATPAPTTIGFDETSVYAACEAAVPADARGGRSTLEPGPIAAGSFGLAASDPYVAEHTNGDPNAIYVNVQYFDNSVFVFSALCVASGDPAAPRVEFIRTLD